jgi:hypothetical protein
MNLNNGPLKVDLIEFVFTNETDVLFTYKRVKSLGELAGLSIYDQLRFTTAVTEITRICQALFGRGHMVFCTDKNSIEVVVSIHGAGTLDRVKLEAEMGKFQASENQLDFSKLTDTFNVDMDGSLLKIVLGKKTTLQKMFFRDKINKWNTILGQVIVVSPYEEIKNSNMELLKLYEGLKRNS